MTINATGGVITTVTDGGVTYRVHTFTASGNLSITTGGNVEYLMIAGGGGGGTDMGGGGGGGGYINAQSVSLTAGTYAIVVGAGGNGAPQTVTNASPSGSNGSNTTFNGITAIGGGGGASNHNNTISNAGVGGSGGGGSGGRMTSASTGGLAAAGTPGQGFAGAGSGVQWYPGGGGGAGGAASQTGSQQANGGIGRSNRMLGTLLFWAGGGAGAGYSTWGGNGGLGGGGGGAPKQDAVTTTNGTGGGSALNSGSNAQLGSLNSQTNVAGGSAGANTGGGGGGGSHYVGNNQGGNGGSGIFIVRYQISLAPGSSIATGGLQSTVIKNGSIFQVHTFNASGNFTVNTSGPFEYLVVAGGGGGGYGRTGNHEGGGGGAGGVRYVANAILNSGQTYAVTVGAGAPPHFQGSGSSLGTLTSTTGGGLGGGGGGANFPNAGGIGPTGGGNGGSGGGGSPGYEVSGGVGILGEGFNGAGTPTNGQGGGGGGAGAPGNPNTTGVGGAGGGGFQTSISGAATFYGGGGGAAGNIQGQGGAGGGGRGGRDGVTAADLATSGVVNTGGGGGGGSVNNSRLGGAGGSGIVIISYLGEGIVPSSNDLAAGETLVITLRIENTDNNTLIPYTITGVDSSDINGASLTGNFNVVNNFSSVSFLITTASKKTMVFQSNGYTQTIAVTENRFGLSLSSSDNNQNYTSINDPQFVNLINAINIINITILQQTNLYNNVIQLGDPVLSGDKTFYSTDFVSITDFNVPEPIPLTFQERWAG